MYGEAAAKGWKSLGQPVNPCKATIVGSLVIVTFLVSDCCFYDFLFINGFIHVACRDVFDFLDDIVAFDYFAEDGVVHVEPGGFGGCDEELGAVSIWA